MKSVFHIYVFTLLLVVVSITPIYSQYGYNHPELKWLTFETEHFKIHYHEGVEWTANESANIAEAVYGPITSFYNYEPDEKIHLVIKDTDDYSNGAAYYYDNKILVWATPLDFPLRGNHNWLRDVITHELAHIISLQRAMKFPRLIPSGYFQIIDYEEERREDVIYGYPRVISSYPLPGVVIPMWLAEGVAQYMYPGSTNDLWDSHRDMLLRDRVVNNNLLSFDDMSHFGKRGTGNESVYNQGYAFVLYLIDRFGTDICQKLIQSLSSPMQISINSSLKKVTSKSGEEIYREWKLYLKNHYENLLNIIKENRVEGDLLVNDAIAQLFPQWSGDSSFYYLSNKDRDFIDQTSLYLYNIKRGKSKLIVPGVNSRAAVSPDGRYIYYSKRSKPNRYGSVYFDIFRYDNRERKEEQVTKWRRAYNPSLSPDGKKMAFITGRDGTSNIVIMDIETGKERVLTDFPRGTSVFTTSWSPDGRLIAFDFHISHGRDIGIYDLKGDYLYILNSVPYDTRDPCFSPDGEWLYFASDETGIFNIYRESIKTGEIEIVTNVLGGAFMPSVNNIGEVVFSLFSNSSYKINLIKEVAPIYPENTVYPISSDSIPDMMEVEELNHPEPVPYSYQFPKIFLSPKLMIDYGILKPGIYFYSDEIIEKMSVFGELSANHLRDWDMYLSFDFHQLNPTIHLEIYNISRNILNVSTQYRGYPVELDYTFYLTEFVLGFSRPVGIYNYLRFDIGYSNYRTSTNEKIPSQGVYLTGFAYDYYKGNYYRLLWKLRRGYPSVNSFTNPDNGFEILTSISRNYDLFLEEFGIYEDFGTLKEIYSKNLYWKVEHEGTVHFRLPYIPKLVSDFRWKLGWLSNPDINSFFYLFGGGMPGLKGYPFYSIEGRNLLSFHFTLRYPIFQEKSIKIGPLNINNAFVGSYFETGNAWSSVNNYPKLDFDTFIKNVSGVTKSVLNDFKRGVGFMVRFSGFSFYAYPTAISLDSVYGIDKFKLIDRAYSINEYGKEWRTYLTILFGL